MGLRWVFILMVVRNWCDCDIFSISFDVGYAITWIMHSMQFSRVSILTTIHILKATLTIRNHKQRTKPSAHPYQPHSNHAPTQSCPLRPLIRFVATHSSTPSDLPLSTPPHRTPTITPPTPSLRSPNLPVTILPLPIVSQKRPISFSPHRIIQPHLSASRQVNHTKYLVT